MENFSLIHYFHLAQSLLCKYLQSTVSITSDDGRIIDFFHKKLFSIFMVLHDEFDFLHFNKNLIIFNLNFNHFNFKLCGHSCNHHHPHESFTIIMLRNYYNLPSSLQRRKTSCKSYCNIDNFFSQQLHYDFTCCCCCCQIVL